MIKKLLITILILSGMSGYSQTVDGVKKAVIEGTTYVKTPKLTVDRSTTTTTETVKNIGGVLYWGNAPISTSSIDTSKIAFTDQENTFTKKQVINDTLRVQKGMSIGGNILPYSETSPYSELGSYTKRFAYGHFKNKLYVGDFSDYSWVYSDRAGLIVRQSGGSGIGLYTPLTGSPGMNWRIWNDDVNGSLNFSKSPYGNEPVSPTVTFTSGYVWSNNPIRVNSIYGYDQISFGWHNDGGAYDNYDLWKMHKTDGFYPYVDSLYDIGMANNRVRRGYFKYMTISNQLKLTNIPNVSTPDSSLYIENGEVKRGLTNPIRSVYDVTSVTLLTTDGTVLFTGDENEAQDTIFLPNPATMTGYKIIVQKNGEDAALVRQYGSTYLYSEGGGRAGDMNLIQYYNYNLEFQSDGINWYCIREDYFDNTP